MKRLFALYREKIGKEELDYCKTYLSLLNIRYQGRMKVEYRIDPDILDCAVLRHLIQPIIENSVVHGFDWSRKENHILIEGRCEGEAIRVSITDNGNGMAAEELAQLRESLNRSDRSAYEKIGLHNVQNRIRMIYKDPYGLGIQSREGIGTRVDMRIQRLSGEELQRNVYGDGS